MVDSVYALDRISRRLRRLQRVYHVDSLDDQHPVLHLDLTPGFRHEPAVAAVYPARLQRASEGSN